MYFHEFVFTSVIPKRTRADLQNRQARGPAAEDWPRENDAVIAASKNHKILLENENVRVLDVPRPWKVWQSAWCDLTASHPSRKKRAKNGPPPVW